MKKRNDKKPLKSQWLLIFFILSLTRLAISADGDIFLEFVADPKNLPSSPGHAFIVITLHTASSIKEEAIGFYPQADNKLKMCTDSGVDGITKFDLKRFNPSVISLKKKITADQRKQVYGLVKEWDTKNYSLTSNNCIDFVHNVALKIGLKTPERSGSTWPEDYISQLIELNK